MIENKLQYYKTQEGYEQQKNANNIPNDALVFVEDTRQIITHGKEGFGGNIATEPYSSAESADINLNDAVLVKEREYSEELKSNARANILNKISDRYEYSKIGRVILKRNLVNSFNVLTQEMINEPNTIYVIDYDYELDSDIIIPENCILEFNGGNIYNSQSYQFKIVGNSTKIMNLYGYDIFTNVLLEGTFSTFTGVYE